MLDDFFVRAVLAGIGLAIIAGPLGCFIVWRRMSYFGDTLAHAALLGVALAILTDLNIILAVFAVAVTVALLLMAMEKYRVFATDALLGLLSHSSLALGLVILALVGTVRVDLSGLLFGDILSVSKSDLAVIYAGGLLVAGLLIWMQRPLLAATVNFDLAKAEGANPQRAEFLFMLLIAAAVAIGLKIVGALLISAMLIIPAVTARRFAQSPEEMMAYAVMIGAIAVIGGMFGSLKLDTPSGPSIVVAALGLFIVSLLGGRLKRLAVDGPGSRR